MRLLAVEACAAISSLLSKEDIEQLIIPIINAAAKVLGPYMSLFHAQSPSFSVVF